MGPFHEALWLTENHFNFWELAKMPGYRDGGPNIYFFSFYPSFQAFLMLIFQKQSNFLFLNHLINIMLASGIVYILYEIISKKYGIPIAIWACAGMFFHPLFLSQSYAISMEIPMLFFGMLGISCFLKKQEARSLFFLLCAFYTKGNGLIFSLIVLIIGIHKISKKYLFFLPVILFFLQIFIIKFYFPRYGGDGEFREMGDLFSQKNIFFFFLAFLSGLLVAYFMDSHKKKNKDYVFIFLYGMIFGFTVVFLKLNFSLFWQTLDIYFLMALACVLTFGLMAYRYCLHSGKVQEFWEENFFPFMSLGFCSLFLMASYMVTNFLPRYFLVCLPFIFFLLAWSMQSLKKSIQYSLLALLLLFYAGNMYGKGYEFFYGKETVYEYHGGMLEATLKYEDDMEANLLLAKSLDKYPWAIFVASYPTIHMLASPKLGYIKEEKSIVSHDRFFFAWKWVLNISEISMLPKEAQKRLLWISHKNHCLVRPFGSKQGDRLLESIKKGDREIQILQRDWKQ